MIIIRLTLAIIACLIIIRMLIEIKYVLKRKTNFIIMNEKYYVYNQGNKAYLIKNTEDALKYIFPYIHVDMCKIINGDENAAYLKMAKKIEEAHKQKAKQKEKEEKTLSYKCDKNVEETFETEKLDEDG